MRIALRSRFVLFFGFEGFGGELAVRLLQQDFHPALGFFKLFLALARKLHSFFKKLHRLIQRELRALQLAHNFFQPRQRLFKIRLLRGFSFFNRR